MQNRKKHGILNDTGATVIPVTDETIRRVPLVSPVGWSKQRAERLQEAHRELLRAVKDKPAGTEAGRIYKPDMSPLSPLVVGEPDGHQVRLPTFGTPYIVIHSHPDGQIFSGTDIEKFVFSGNMEMMTAIGNNGALYVAQKMSQYDGFQAYRQYQELKAALRKHAEAEDMDKYISAIEDFLNGGNAYGLEFIKGGT